MSNPVASDERIAKACKDLIAAYNYSSDPTLKLDARLPGAILKEIASWGLGYEKEEKHEHMTHFSAAVPDLMFRSYPFEIKVHIGTWIWLSYTIELDTASMGQAAISGFQRLLIAQKPQLHPLLDRYAAILQKMYSLRLSQLAADCIVTSSLQLVWSSVLEPNPTYKAMPALPGGSMWPAIVRSRNSLGEGLAFMAFLSSNEESQKDGDMMLYLQAIPQIQVFLDATNDIFRFNFEEKTNDHQNYIREISAHYPGKSHADTLDEMVVQAAAAAHSVDGLLEGAGWIETRWKELKQGFVAMHRWNKAPYMLGDMGLSEEIPYDQPH